jgi:hypothetical protein
METSELVSVLRERLHISLRIESEWEYSGEFATVAISLDFIDDDGEIHTISHDYDSIRINSD